MFSLFESFVILNSPELGKSLWAGAGLIFAIIGAGLIGSALFPQYQETYKVKNTVGVNKQMFTLHTVVAFFYLVGAILFAIDGCTNSTEMKEKDCYFSAMTGIVFAILNLFGFIGNAYIILLKLWQSRCACNCGLTESEYYEKNVYPKLESLEK